MCDNTRLCTLIFYVLLVLVMDGVPYASVTNFQKCIPGDVDVVTRCTKQFCCTSILNVHALSLQFPELGVLIDRKFRHNGDSAKALQLVCKVSRCEDAHTHTHTHTFFNSTEPRAA